MGAYRGELELSERCQYLGTRIDDYESSDPGLQGPWTVRFLTLTSGFDLGHATWSTNMLSIFNTLMVDQFDAVGLWQLDSHASGKIHAHVVIKLPVLKMGDYDLILAHWAKNVGFIDDKEVVSLMKSISYARKSEDDGVLVGNTEYFGNIFRIQEGEVQLPLPTLEVS